MVMGWMKKHSMVVLQLGFSTRYNDRKGLGRFGVGATYCKLFRSAGVLLFVPVPMAMETLLATYIDLDEIAGQYPDGHS